MLLTTLNLAVETSQGTEALKFEGKRCEWVGRDRAALQAHIDELARLGHTATNDPSKPRVNCGQDRPGS
jgi:hypothetical protein